MSPPFRADHVGSFLRPTSLRAAREKFFAREIDASALRAVEDECIREVVKRQQDVGLKGITDGEFRRTYFHVDFLDRLEGVEVRYGEFSSAFRKDDGTQVGFKPPTMHVESKVRHTTSIQGPDFDFLKSVVAQTPKVCIPAPSMLHFRGGREAISQAVYPRLEDFYDDLTKAYADEIDDLARRGLRYLQLDDTNLAYLCDPAIRERTRARGDDPDALVRLYCKPIGPRT
jgi:5-methyltetrahydropteroyltriglutamate--homocysteine methyltransferase